MTHKEITDPRFISILKHTDISKKGIEIAPYHSPILPKSDGHNVFILDVFDTDRLQANAKNDKNINKAGEAKIEPVDFVGDACDLGAIITKAGMVGQLGYVISSHNFEHLANPIKFLQGVGLALETGGVLSMAVPDYRCCFDRFRIPTRLSDWLTAYHLDKKQPAAADLFDTRVGYATRGDDIAYAVGFDSAYPSTPYVACKDFREEYNKFCKEIKKPSPYQDTHCNVLFPELLELYLRDLRHLDLIDLEISAPSKSMGIEFHIYLKKVATPSQTSEEDHRKVRQDLLIKIMHGMGEGGFRRKKTIFTFFKSLNHKRLARRRASLSNKPQPK
ncbi:MAG: adenine phosphoribosyltransferase [Proteobacteria bacterium]|nr:adenine phosphoribosyltransferase [Pseudomonadota bacterium]